MTQKEPIAVVGMAGLFPGADNVEIFWQNILNGMDACAEVDPDRWRVAPDTMYHPKPQPDKAYSKRCNLITDFKFDHRSSSAAEFYTWVAGLTDIID